MLFPLRIAWLGALATAVLLSALVASPALAGERACLRLGLDEWPPYEFTDQGRAQGLSTEILLAVLDGLDRCVASAKAYPWGRGLSLLRDGDLDALYSADYRPERETWAVYPTEPLLESAWVVYVRKARADLREARGLDDLSDRPGLRLGTVRGYAYPPALSELLARKPELRDPTGGVGTDELNFRRMAAGRLDALICDRYNGAWLAHALGLEDKVRPLPEPVATSRLYPLFRRGALSDAELTRFDAALRAFKTTPAYRNILRRWLAGPH